MKGRFKAIRDHCLTVASSPLLWLCLMIVFAAAFALLSDSVKCSIFWKHMVSLPEPERCALCADAGYDGNCPCLVKLNTGEVGALGVFHEAEELEDVGISDRDNTGRFLVAGLWVENTADAQHSASIVTLPQKALYISPNLYCRDCRAKIAEVIETERILLDGYILADLSDLEHIRLYPITDGAIYDIHGYTVEVSREKRSEGFTIRVTEAF